RADPDVVDPDETADMPDVRDEVVQPGSDAGPGLAEGRVRADPEDATLRAQDPEDLVRDVPRIVAEGPCIRVRDDAWVGRALDRLARGAGARVGEVDQDSEVVQLGDAGASQLCEPGVRHLQAAAPKGVALVVGQLGHPETQAVQNPKQG